MSKKQTAVVERDEEDDVLLEWRAARLAECGLATSDAYLGALIELDWHAIARLVRSGCDPELALRIVA